MHLTYRRSGWRFQIRAPRDVEHAFGSTPIRLNLGPMGKRHAARTARLLAGHAESVFLACRKGAEMTKDELIEELQAMLIGAMDLSESILQAADRRREHEVKAATLNARTEHLQEQADMGRRLLSLGKGIDSLRDSLATIPTNSPNDVARRIDELSNLVQQALSGGPDRPLLLDELETWLKLRKGHVADKKIRMDENRIRDFAAFAGNKPVNRYRYSDFQAFANLLVRVPSNYVKEPRLREMTRQEAADYNDSLPAARRYETLVGTAIETNYFSPLRMFFQVMAAEHEFRSPLADATITIPPTAKESVERSPFPVEDLNIWFAAAAKETRPDLKWLPLLGTLTGARIAELIFLQGKDIYEIQTGLWVADLASDLSVGDGRSQKRQIKNKSSRRLFALHEAFTETGFIAYCQSRKPDDWLFPQAFFHGKTRVTDPAGAASKRLNSWLKAVGIHKPLENTFHSTRHTAKDIMRIAKVDDRTSNRQTGHAMTSVADRYGSKKMRPDEVEVLAALPLPEGLDLSPYFPK